MISLNPIGIHSELSRKKDTALKNRAFLTKKTLGAPNFGTVHFFKIFGMFFGATPKSMVQYGI